MAERPDTIIVVAEDNASYRLITTKNGQSECLLFDDPKLLARFLRTFPHDCPLFLAHDVSTAKGVSFFSLNDPLLNVVNAHFEQLVIMVLTSPQVVNFAIAEKLHGVVPVSVTLPTWSKDELVQCGLLANDADPKYDKFGGVPRSYKASRQQQTMKSAMIGFKVEEMALLKFSWSCSNDLVQLVPDAKFHNFSHMEPVSKLAAAIISKEFGIALHAHYKTVIAERHGTFSGVQLEWWFLSILRALGSNMGTPIRVTLPLVALMTPPANETAVLTLDSSKLAEIVDFPGRSISDLFTAIGRLAVPRPSDEPTTFILIPTDPSFPILDAAVVTWGGTWWLLDAFQCTGAKSHSAPTASAKTFDSELAAHGRMVKLQRLVIVGFQGVEKVQKRDDNQAFVENCQWKLDMCATSVGNPE